MSLLERIERAQQLVEQIGLDVSLSGADDLDDLQTILYDLRAALTAQAEEVERLRDALESISAWASIAQQMVGGANNFTKTMGRAADQALKGESQ